MNSNNGNLEAAKNRNWGRFDSSALHIQHALKQTAVQKKYYKPHAQAINTFLVSTHCPKNNLNLCIKTVPFADGASCKSILLCARHTVLYSVHCTLYSTVFTLSATGLVVCTVKDCFLGQCCFHFVCPELIFCQFVTVLNNCKNKHLFTRTDNV